MVLLKLVGLVPCLTPKITNPWAGEVMALMGPSGSGKTTLLNVLTRRAATSKNKPEGDVLINGSVLSRHVFQKLTSFVEQDDTLIGSLTVYETLDFAARLALPR